MKGHIACIENLEKTEIELHDTETKNKDLPHPQNDGVRFSHQEKVKDSNGNIKKDSDGNSIEEEVLDVPLGKNEYKFSTSTGKEVIYTCEDGFRSKI